MKGKGRMSGYEKGRGQSDARPRALFEGPQILS